MTYIDLLERVAHHGDQHIEHDEDDCRDVGPEQTVPDELSQSVVGRVGGDEVLWRPEVSLVDDGWLRVSHTERRPEQAVHSLVESVDQNT